MIKKKDSKDTKIDLEIFSRRNKSPYPELQHFDTLYYKRPYSMTSNVFEKFCDTQITYNSTILNNSDQDFKTSPAQSHDALPNLDHVQIDLTCNEVMPLEELSFNVTEQNDISSSTYAFQCGFDSDDSVRDKDYLPSDSSDDFESIKSSSPKSHVLQTNVSS
ncbi:unnamed protein product [Parnassius apollo]|uniref:(apollo) hypothetical protein n=1 Tax=Parnassius apollo TaxID=110799 RepID=A0A8S3XFN0_PARAO|nr:unnamed protein product [Parnassius apollo]